MFWKRDKLKSDRESEETSREVSRRAGVMARAHLELLAFEGSLDNQTVSIIAESHPRTIDRQRPAISPPAFRAPNVKERSTYSEAAEGVFGIIAKALSPWQNTLKELGPLGVGYFSGDNANSLAQDLITAIFVLRNQSLYGIYDEDAATVIKAQATILLVEKAGSAQLAVYDLFKRLWLGAIATLEPPQLLISAELIKRSNQRTGKAGLQNNNPLIEVIIADKLVSTGLYVWRTIDNSIELVDQ